MTTNVKKLLKEITGMIAKLTEEEKAQFREVLIRNSERTGKKK